MAYGNFVAGSCKTRVPQNWRTRSVVLFKISVGDLNRISMQLKCESVIAWLGLFGLRYCRLLLLWFVQHWGCLRKKKKNRCVVWWAGFFCKKLVKPLACTTSHEKTTTLSSFLGIRVFQGKYPIKVRLSKKLDNTYLFPFCSFEKLKGEVCGEASYGALLVLLENIYIFRSKWQTQ